MHFHKIFIIVAYSKLYQNSCKPIGIAAHKILAKNLKRPLLIRDAMSLLLLSQHCNKKGKS